MIAASALHHKIENKETLESQQHDSWKESWRTTTASLQRPGICIFFFFCSVSCAYANLGNKTKPNKTKQTNKQTNKA